MKKYLRRALVTLAAFFPCAASAQTAPTTFAGLAAIAVNVISILTGLAMGVGVFYYFLGMAKTMSESGSAKGWSRLRDQAVWGVLAIFVMVAVWGLLRVIALSLFGTSIESIGN